MLRSSLVTPAADADTSLLLLACSQPAPSLLPPRTFSQQTHTRSQLLPAACLPCLQVLEPLGAADLLWVAALPAVSEELLFRGALIPASYPDWWVGRAGGRAGG